MFAIIDIETTGNSYKYGHITEIAIYQHNGLKITNSFSSLVNPEIDIPFYITKLTGIDNNMVKNAPRFFACKLLIRDKKIFLSFILIDLHQYKG